MKRFRLAALTAVSAVASAGCLMAPYLSSQAGREPAVTSGSCDVKPMWTLPAFRPADRWSLLDAADWPPTDRAPAIPPALVETGPGRSELLAALPDGLAALDPESGARLSGTQVAGPSRGIRVATSGVLGAARPPFRIRGYGHAAEDWTPVVDDPPARAFAVVPAGVVVWTGSELVLYAPTGESAWRLEKTRGKFAGAAQWGEMILVSFLEEERGYVTNAYARGDGAVRWSVEGRLLAVRGREIVVAAKNVLVLDSAGHAGESLEAPEQVPGMPPVDVPADAERDGPHAKASLVYAARSPNLRSATGYDRLMGRTYGPGRAWQQQLGGTARQAPVVAGGMVFVTLGASFSGVADLGGAFETLEAHDPRDGAVLFQVSFPAGFLSFCADRERLFVWTRDGSLRAFRLVPRKP